MSLKYDASYLTGLSFKKTNMAPKDENKGPVFEYMHDEVWPSPYEIISEGVVRFNLYFPKAEKVKIRTYTDAFDLEKEGDCFVGICKVGTGFIGLMINVDDQEVIYPALPIGYGGNKPINFMQIMESDSVIEPREQQHGTVIIDFFSSRVTGNLERIYLYLPPDYHEKQDKKYPILYLQHGHGENETTWVNQGKVNFIYDNLIAEGKAKPAVIVMCNGMVAIEKEDGVKVDAIEAFEKMLVTEVMPYVESKYRVLGNKANRAMAGLSMGSMQTSVITLKHQDLFNYVGIFSGFVRDILSDYDKHLNPAYLEVYSKNIKYIFRAMGENDIFLEAFLSDDQLLEQYKVAHERVIYPGLHEWKVWQHCIHDFSQKIFEDDDEI